MLSYHSKPATTKHKQFFQFMHTLFSDYRSTKRYGNNAEDPRGFCELVRELSVKNGFLASIQIYQRARQGLDVSTGLGQHLACLNHYKSRDAYRTLPELSVEDWDCLLDTYVEHCRARYQGIPYPHVQQLRAGIRKMVQPGATKAETSKSTSDDGEAYNALLRKLIAERGAPLAGAAPCGPKF